MRTCLPCVASCVLVINAGFEGRAEIPVGPENKQRAAVQRALPYLARRTDAWIKQNKCNSCHQVPHALWAMNEARDGGFVVDDRLAEWNQWSMAFVLRDTENAEDIKTLAGERTDELYQLLLARAATNAPTAGGPTSAREKLASMLHLGKDQSGRWRAGGRLPDQKRPKRETDEVTTFWSLHAARSLGTHSRSTNSDREFATPDLTHTGTSTEHLILKYLLSLQDGQTDQAASFQLQILAHQNDDGGWGWLLHDASDALATGQVLYALSFMNSTQVDKPVERARRFLLQTQQEDGSWIVPSTLEEEHAKPSVVSNDWGTAWAVIGLARTITP